MTLPGIAGIVLTVGMAVDANVLIFSRIREERMRGLADPQAIRVGFERAFVTILDSNITTLLVAIILGGNWFWACEGFRDYLGYWYLHVALYGNLGHTFTC